ncbi:MAG TPA: pilin [Patescibacteria group bacterium]|nr:pilin [Patescibacteria group bacterium]
MVGNNLKKYAIGAAVVAAAVIPAVAMAQGVDLGLNYATAIGLGTQDVRSTVSNVIKAFMGLLGIVAVVIILLGGFKWMTAGGNEEKVAEAKKLIISGIIGLVIIMSAYAIAQFVVSAIINGTSA